MSFGEASSTAPVTLEAIDDVIPPPSVAKIAPHIQFERKRFEQQGAGLGLVIAKRLTELLGGQMLITSKTERETLVRVSFALPGA